MNNICKGIFLAWAGVQVTGKLLKWLWGLWGLC